MAEPVDFISIIKDIRGNTFDPGTGLPLNGKWFDIKGWNTAVSAAATQVAADLVDVTAKTATATTKASEASASAATALTYKDAAVVSELAAASSASAAAANVNTAGVAATTATTKAAEAASSAVLAGNSVTSAASYATNASGSATTASDSAASASSSATTATTSKNAAVVAEGNALTYSSAASASATSASNASVAAASSAATATTKATEATTQRNFAADWAIKAEDVAVNDGTNPSGFSAYHWAKKAQAAVGGVQNISDLADVPALAGAANRYLRVNSGATAIEFDTLTQEDVGLANVNNTSDVNKPISSATQAALDTKSSQTEMNTTTSRVTALEGNTGGITTQAAGGSDPIRFQANKAVYTTAVQNLGTLQDAELTTYGLIKAALAAATIGTY